MSCALSRAAILASGKNQFNPGTLNRRFAVSFLSMNFWEYIGRHFFEALYLTEYNARASFTPGEKARPLSP
jgi:hypothetical protein